MPRSVGFGSAAIVLAAVLADGVFAVFPSVHFADLLPRLFFFVLLPLLVPVS